MQYTLDFIRFVNCFSSIATEKKLTEKDLLKTKLKEYQGYLDFSKSIDLLDDDLEFINYKKNLKCKK